MKRWKILVSVPFAAVLLLALAGAAPSTAQIHEATLATQAVTAVPPAGNWVSGFHSPGVNDQVNALANGPDGSLYVGGSFTAAGGVVVNYVARWDGTTWHPLGSGMDKSVSALAVDDHGNVYAGGFFTMAGGMTANRVARWDGTTWHALGSGTDEGVLALAFGPDGSLYAGGRFTAASGISANHIARWDGTAWHPLGNGIDGSVRALAFGLDGLLYTGGSFTTAGGVSANFIARWDGTMWHPLGSGMAGYGYYAAVYTLAVDELGNLYAGGGFTTAGGVPANYVARWDSTASSWHALGSGLESPYIDGGVMALAFGSDGSLYAGGAFTTAGGAPANSIARWDGATSSWHTLGNGVSVNQSNRSGHVFALATKPDGSLYAGGWFYTAGDTVASHIARWAAPASSWHALTQGNGMSAPINALARGSDGSLYAGGEFTTAGGEVANYIARWDGTAWHPLGGGMDFYVEALATGLDGSLYAGGLFDTAGDVEAHHIARWDKATAAWRPLGSGMGDRVWALAVDKLGQVYAGGPFTTADGKAVNRIARWDGTTWSSLGGGMGGGYSGVRALAIGSDGSLYAGGDFTTAGGVAANRIARWDGAAWHPLGSGMECGSSYCGVVYALAVGPDGSLYAGGDFTTAGGVATNRIARWDRTTWHPLGSGMDATVYALAVDKLGNVYAGGRFATAGGVSANYIARWDGTMWHPLGSGMGGRSDPGVRTLLLGPGFSLYVGGTFTTASGIPSNYIALWTIEYKILFLPLIRH